MRVIVSSRDNIRSMQRIVLSMVLCSALLMFEALMVSNSCYAFTEIFGQAYDSVIRWIGLGKKSPDSHLPETKAPEPASPSPPSPTPNVSQPPSKLPPSSESWWRRFKDWIRPAPSPTPSPSGNWVGTILVGIGVLIACLTVIFKIVKPPQVNNQDPLPPRIEGTVQYDLEVQKAAFPRNLIQFEHYDGAKCLVVFLFLLALYFFFSVLFEESGSWYEVWKYVTQPIKFIASLSGLIVAYLVLWLTFDRKSIEGYALSIFSFVIGIVYIILPIDAIPDAIPFFGQLDDIVIGGGSILLALRAWLTQELRKKDIENVRLLLRDGKTEESLKKLLSERGYAPKKFFE